MAARDLRGESGTELVRRGSQTSQPSSIAEEAPGQGEGAEKEGCWKRLMAAAFGIGALAVTYEGTTKDSQGSFQDLGVDELQDAAGSVFEEDRFYCGCKCVMHVVGLLYVPTKTLQHMQDDIYNLKSKGDEITGFFLFMFYCFALGILAIGWTLQVTKTAVHWCARTFSPFTESKSFYILYYGHAPPERPEEGEVEQSARGVEEGQPAPGPSHDFFKPNVTIATVFTSSFLGFLMPLFFVMNMFWAEEDIRTFDPNKTPEWKHYLGILDMQFSMLILASKFKSFVAAARIIHQVWPLLVSMFLHFYCMELCCGLDENLAPGMKMWSLCRPLYFGPEPGQKTTDGPCPLLPCTCVGCHSLYDYTACNSAMGVYDTFLPLLKQME